MSEEVREPKRGDAAWKEQRDEISKRNADAHRRSGAAEKQRQARMASTVRADAEREADQLRALNERIAKQQKRASR